MRARTLEGRRIGLPFLFLDLTALRRVSIREWLRHELVCDLKGLMGKTTLFGRSDRDLWSATFGVGFFGDGTVGVSEIRRSLGVVVWRWRDVTWRLASFFWQELSN